MALCARADDSPAADCGVEPAAGAANQEWAQWRIWGQVVSSAGGGQGTSVLRRTGTIEQHTQAQKRRRSVLAGTSPAAANKSETASGKGQTGETRGAGHVTGDPPRGLGAWVGYGTPLLRFRTGLAFGEGQAAAGRNSRVDLHIARAIQAHGGRVTGKAKAG
jgi:hypothetical protein